MRIPGKFTALAVIAGLLSIVSCQDKNPAEPDRLTDRDARSAETDTSTTPEKPWEEFSLSVVNEKFSIKAHVPDTLGGKGLVLIFTTERELGCNNSDIFLQAPVRGESPYQIDIRDFVFQTDCVASDRKATGEILFYPVVEGEHHLAVRIGEKVYRGKIIRTEKKYLFEWPDESQFKFPEKSLAL